MPKNWPVDLSCLPKPSDEITQDQIDSAVAMAVDTLWALSGRQFGVEEVIERPKPFGCCGPRSAWHDPSSARMVYLPGPVAEILEIKIGDTVLDKTQYVNEFIRLYRIGNDWPCQDMRKPLPETGTWSVRYLLGRKVPDGVDKLTGLLANEFLLGCAGDKKCRLPRFLAAAPRGTTNLDPIRFFREGKTGIPEIDLWLQAVNPHYLITPPQVV